MALSGYAWELYLPFGVIHLSGGIPPTYIGHGLHAILEGDDLISHYFILGLTFSETSLFFSWKRNELAPAITSS